MHQRLTKPVAIVLGSAMLAAGGYAAIAQGQSTQTTPQEIDFKVTHFSNKFLDAKPKGPSIGDRFVDSGKLADPKSGRSLGYVFQACDFAKVAKVELSNCYGGVQLKAGRITFADAGTDEGRYTHVAITGGSGSYAAARGTIVFDAGKKENGKSITGRILVQP